MLLIYSPEDGDRTEFVFRPDEMFSVEAEQLEEIGGNAWQTWEQFVGLIYAGQFKARRALLWVCRKRTEPNLRFVDLVVKTGEVWLQAEETEIAEARSLIEGDESLSEDAKAEQLAQLEDEPETNVAPVEDPVGKGEGGDSGTAST